MTVTEWMVEREERILGSSVMVESARPGIVEMTWSKLFGGWFAVVDIYYS
jgi:hypothetical protein